MAWKIDIRGQVNPWALPALAESFQLETAVKTIQFSVHMQHLLLWEQFGIIGYELQVRWESLRRLGKLLELFTRSHMSDQIEVVLYSTVSCTVQLRVGINGVDLAWKKLTTVPVTVHRKSNGEWPGVDGERPAWMAQDRSEYWTYGAGRFWTWQSGLEWDWVKGNQVVRREQI